MTGDLTALLRKSDIELAATDPDRNINRAYRISRTQDLFGWVMVTWEWGRAGQSHQTRTRAFPAEAQAMAFTRQLLLRRATAPRRIGVAYCPIADVA